MFFSQLCLNLTTGVPIFLKVESLMKMISTLVSTHLACNFFILSFSVFHLNVSVKIVIARTWWKSVINRSHDSFSIQKGLIYLSEIYSLTSRVHVFSVLMEIKPCSKLQSASPSYCERGLHILLTSMKIYDNTFLWWTQLLISTWKSHIIFILFHFMTCEIIILFQAPQWKEGPLFQNTQVEYLKRYFVVKFGHFSIHIPTPSIAK